MLIAVIEGQAAGHEIVERDECEPLGGMAAR